MDEVQWNELLQQISTRMFGQPLAGMSPFSEGAERGQINPLCRAQKLDPHQPEPVRTVTPTLSDQTPGLQRLNDPASENEIDFKEHDEVEVTALFKMEIMFTSSQLTYPIKVEEILW